MEDFPQGEFFFSTKCKSDLKPKRQQGVKKDVMFWADRNLKEANSYCSL